jgi:hypothetical protein
MGETLKKSAKSDVVDKTPAKVMTPETLNVIQRFLKAHEKKRAKKSKSSKSGDRYKAAWDAALDPIALKIGLIPVGSPFEGDRIKLEKTLEKIGDKRDPSRDLPAEIREALVKVSAKADTLKAEWDGYCETLMPAVSQKRPKVPIWWSEIIPRSTEPIWPTKRRRSPPSFPPVSSKSANSTMKTTSRIRWWTLRHLPHPLMPSCRLSGPRWQRR